MNQIHIKHFKTGRNRRGNTLLLAILMTLLLFVIGITFLSTAITSKTSTQSISYQAELDNGVDIVVDKIGDVLVQDLFGSELDKGFLDGTADNEPYDYPGPPDRWLASSEPEEFPNPAGGTYYGWRQYSDLWGNFDYSVVSGYNKQLDGLAFRHDPPLINRAADDTEYWDTDFPNFSDIHRVEGYAPLVCDIVDPEQNIENTLLNNSFDYSSPPWPDYTPWPTARHNGMRADADGDGVADSRWVRINRLGPDGRYLWVAVRIVDNGSMINLNTAFRDPTGTSDWDGSLLTHVNLDGIKATTEGGTIEEFQQARCGGLPGILDQSYHDEVARRLLNPVSGYSPFDIMDELELRNRYLLFSSVGDTRCSTIWPVTFNPGAGAVGVKLPYDHPDDIPDWYDKVQPDWGSWEPPYNIGAYNRRHLVTTYNFDRVMTPRENNVLPSGLSAEWTNWKNTDAPGEFAAIDMNYNTSTTIRNAAKPTLKQVAAAIYMAGLSDSDNAVSHPSIEALQEYFNALTPYNYGLSNQDICQHFACMLAANMADYSDTDSDSSPLSLGDTEYYGFESEAPQFYIIRLGVSGYKETSGSTTEEHYAIVLYNSTGSSANLNNWEIEVKSGAGSGTKYSLPSVDVGSDNICVLIDEDATSVTDMGFKLADFSGLVEVEIVAGFDFGENDKIILLHNSKPCDQVVVQNFPDTDPPSAGTRNIWHTDERNNNRYISDNNNNAIQVWDRYLSNWNEKGDDIGDLEDDANPPATKIAAEIQTKNRDAPFLNMGEISNVLGVGSMKLERGVAGEYDYITLSEFWDAYINYGTDQTDITSEEYKLGRIDLADPNFIGIGQYLTVFAPFNDAVDNDGDGLSDNPLVDGEDNDGYNGVDDAAEIYDDYGTNAEVAIAGRININTAPWYVIAQLPWIEPELARAIVAYRDFEIADLEPLPTDNKIDYRSSRAEGMNLNDAAVDVLPEVREDPGYMGISELLNVTHDIDKDGGSEYKPLYDIRQYGRDLDVSDIPINNNNIGSMDPGPFYDVDEQANDLRERDIIFHRISNLVTVRSDVFTAYILVRLGANGPQKRMIAIFDRSNVFDNSQRPQLIALHPVPDPR